jgi:hypothetical protein
MPKITEGQFALGGLAFAVVWLLVVLPLLYRPAQQAPKVYAQQETNGALKGEANAKGSPPQAAQANEERSWKHAEQGEEEGTEFWPPFLGIRLKITDSLLALFTAGLLIFTGLLWRSTDKLWAAGVRQAELTQTALIGDQRAWIMVSMEIETLKFLDSGDKSAPGAEAWIRIKISNVGRTPALNATLHIALVGGEKYFTAIAARRFADQHQDCFTGRFVSPSDDYETETLVEASGAELYRYGRAGEMKPLIVGCVTYQILQDSEIHQTGFVYNIQRCWTESGDLRIFGNEQEELDINEVEPVAAPGGFVT